jgi:hypothetical protein
MDLTGKIQLNVSRNCKSKPEMIASNHVPASDTVLWVLSTAPVVIESSQSKQFKYTENFE